MLSYGGTLAHIVPGRGNRSIRNGKNLGTVADDSHGQGDAIIRSTVPHLSCLNHRPLLPKGTLERSCFLI